MLPIGCKDKILDGTMCAFISKDVELNINDKFLFVQNYEPIVLVKEDDIFHADKVIAKAECVGVVKGRLDFIKDDNLKYYRDVEFDIHNSRLCYRYECNQEEQYFNELLGFEAKQEDNYFNINHCYKYYKALLGDTMEGYLHIFELIKEGE